MRLGQDQHQGDGIVGKGDVTDLKDVPVSGPDGCGGHLGELRDIGYRRGWRDGRVHGVEHFRRPRFLPPQF